MGIRDHFPICGNFHGNFLLEFYEGFFADGVLNHFPICGTRIHLHALVIDMAHAIGSGILAPSDAIDVCVSKHQSALIGGDGDPSSSQGSRGPQARGYRPARR